MKNNALDTSGWREFKIGDLFDISGSRTTPKNKLEQIGEGKYPYITTQATNNGIAGYYATYTEKGHCLTIDSAVLGICFYQEQDFTASDHVEILRPKFFMSKEVAIFFTVLLNKTGSILGYAYNKKRSQTAIKTESKIAESKITEFKKDFLVLLYRDSSGLCPQNDTSSHSERSEESKNAESTKDISAFSNPKYDTHNIDFVFMESFIKEIEKEHFLSLIKYYHKLMSAYNEVLDSNLKPTNVGVGH